MTFNKSQSLGLFMHFHQFRKPLFYLTVGIFLWSSCDISDTPDPVASNVYLVSLEEVNEITALQALAAATFIDFEEVGDHIVSDAMVYRMVYNTTYKGEPIQASGLIGIPTDKSLEMAIASIHHGTSIRKDDAPSASPNDYYFFSAMSVTGLITLVPDYIGFGASEQLFHPYYVEEGEALPIVDMIHATVELMEDSSMTWNEDLFLAGYSEGGYVTMATHKYIQEHPEEGLTVTASAPAAGGYDLLHMQEYFTSQETYKQPFYLAYVISAHKNWYDWSEPLSVFFQEPYASRIPGLLDGSKGGGDINRELTTKVGDLLHPDIINHFNSDEKYTKFRQTLQENSLLDWTPLAPVRMYHGTEDVTVPFSNSIASFEALKGNGAGDKIELIAIEGADHSSGLMPMTKDAILWMLEMD